MCSPEASCGFTYCRWGVSITMDMNMGRFLICRLNPKTAFCWKPSLMLRIYWFWSVMNRTSLRPLKLASSMSFTTGCGGGRGGRKTDVSEVCCNDQITQSQADNEFHCQTHGYKNLFGEINWNWLGTAVPQGMLRCVCLNRPHHRG